MKRRHKRRSNLAKPLYAAVALFPFSLWNFYRHKPGIFYLHLLSASFILFVLWAAWRLAHRERKKRQSSLMRNASYIKSRAQQGSILRLLWKKMRARGMSMTDVEKKIRPRAGYKK